MGFAALVASVRDAVQRLGGEQLPRGRYLAFISYRHVGPDASWALWLHEKLETYRLPRRLARTRELPRRLGRIAQDEKELSTSSDVGKTIRDTLDRSDWLIVVCSPRAKKSEWVSEEIEHFHRTGRDERVLSLLIEGEPATAFPEPLFRIRAGMTSSATTINAIQPLAADVRPRQGIRRSKTRRVAFLRLAATLIGCTFDDLVRRDNERRRRRIAWSCGVLAVLAVVVTGASVYVQQQRRAARQSEAEALVEEALQRSAGSEAAAFLADLPTTFANAGRWVRAIHTGLTWTLVERTDRETKGAIAWSPDGTLFAWGDDEELLHVWDVATGRHRFLGTPDLEYTNPIQVISWSPDRDVLATLSASGKVQIWHLASGSSRVLNDLGGVSFKVDEFALAWSQDGSRLAARAGNSLCAWDMHAQKLIVRGAIDYGSGFEWSKDLELVSIYHPPTGIEKIPAGIWFRPSDRTIALTPSLAITTAVLSPDATRLAVGTSEGGLRHGELTHEELHLAPATSYPSRRSRFREVEPRSDNPETDIQRLRLEWSPTGNAVAYLNGGTPGWWDLDYAFELPHADARTIAWSPEGERLAVGLESGEIYIWRPDLSEGIPDAVFRAHEGAGIVSLAWSPDGRALASVSEVGPVQIWDTLTTVGKTIQPSSTFHEIGKVETRWFWGLAWSPTHPAVAAWTTNDEIALLHGSGKRDWWQANGVVQSTALAMNPFSWSPDGSVLAFVDSQRRIVLLDARSLARRELGDLQDDVDTVSWSPNGKGLAIATSGRVLVWSIPNERMALEILSKGFSTVAWSADSNRLAVGRWDGDVFIHDLLSGLRTTLRAGDRQISDAVRRLEWAPREMLTVVNNADQIEVWNVSARTSRSIQAGATGVYAWSPVEDEIAVADARQIDFFNTDGSTARPSLRLDFHELYSYNVSAISWSPDGRYLAASGERDSVRVWDVDSRLSLAFIGHSGAIESVAWSHDGRHLASSSRDGTVRIWPALWFGEAIRELAARQPNLEIDPEGNLRSTQFRGLPWRKVQPSDR